MSKPKFTKGVTPVGETLFSHILATEVITKGDKKKDTGKYTVMLKLSEADKKKLLKKIDAEWEKYKNELEGKKLKYDYYNGLKEYKEQEYFKFSMNEHFVNSKTGETVHLHCPIFDSANEEISKTLSEEFGNGSKVRVAYELRPYFMSEKTYGISLRLSAIQIIDLVEFGQKSADSYGFEMSEDGYTASKAPEEDIFTDSGEEEVSPEDEF